MQRLIYHGVICAGNGWVYDFVTIQCTVVDRAKGPGIGLRDCKSPQSGQHKKAGDDLLIARLLPEARGPEFI